MSAFESAFRAMMREEMHIVVREELRAFSAEQSPANATVARGVPADGYLSVEEAAELARVSKNTIRAWVKDGKLPRRMAGRELRVRRDELHQLLAAEPDASGPTPEAVVANLLGRRRA